MSSEPVGLDVGDLVRFCQGDEARTVLQGRVTRAPWGSRKQNVSIRAAGTGALYVRLVASVELIEKAGPAAGSGQARPEGYEPYEITYRRTP
jgi:hypothetical protein